MFFYNLSECDSETDTVFNILNSKFTFGSQQIDRFCEDKFGILVIERSLACTCIASIF